METLGTAIVAVIVVPAVVCGYIIATEWVIRGLSGPAKSRVRPWLWVLPAFLFLTVFLIYPTIRTFINSLFDRQGEFIGLQNYLACSRAPISGHVLANNALWIVFFTGVVLAIGLLIAILADRVRYETIVKALIFIPMAISFVAAGVIWRFMYDFNPNIGTLNAGLVAVGLEAQALIQEWPRNTFMFIIVGIWMWVGFAIVILSAG